MSRNKYPEVTVEKILDVSQRLFYEKGYEKTSIQDIVNELGGLSKGAIYHHFKSKEDILCELEERIFKDNNPFAVVEKEKNLNGLQKLKYVIELNQKNQAMDENSQITEQFVPLLENPHILASTIQSNRKYLSPCFRKLIQEGIDDGSIKTKYAKELSELLPLMELWMMPSVFPASDEEIKHKFEFLKNMFEKMGLPIFDENVVGILKNKK
ncbi:MAG: TetR/AcrR family transcriptional regulator [Lachnobacterium sp.]|nr:TetR/AcrR family transcriptional regulator [uncultured Agathobacter sp.]MCI7112585.1 TetR/AcrR family transcriptional regulator [Lachnobacterium sp.]